ncbi:GPI-anchor transamidase component PIGT-like [Babylonia areolata]|uniref:GPI-anchor transamidase component PIGT-like n=1 Tax=Babylonia areolata TaxID=304850 RepID=UPI003FD5FD8F
MADFGRLMLSWLTVLVFYCCLQHSKASTNDRFYEELYIKPLQSGHVLFDFQFTTKWNVSVHDVEKFQHYRLFPKSLGDVLAAYHVQELHLTQTQGRWRHQSWGYPVEDAPAGAQLWVWFKPTVTDVDKTWKELVNALSGLFCSSLNFLDEKSTVAPRWSFRPRGVASKDYAKFSDYVRYGALPREIVCTENLTPWKKLLPCDSKAGLSTLFRAEKLHDADYHSLSVHFRPVCADSSCQSEAVELTQSLSLVVDLVLTGDGFQNWSIHRVFGQTVSAHCPLASRSQVFVDTSSNQDEELFSLTPAPTEERAMPESRGVRRLAVYNVAQVVAARKILNLVATYNVRQRYGRSVSPPVYAHRYVTGYGLEKGGVSCLIYNTLSTTLPILYMDSLPWFTRVFFKSVRVESRGTEVPYKIHYIPGRDRERSYHLEMAFTLPPRSVTKVSLQFERAFLKWTEYPPDANHGFYINSAVISVNLPSDKTFIAPSHNTSTLLDMVSDESLSHFVRLYTESLLVSLPTPDFSMPYNVICLACTVVAIAFGSIHNLTTRRFILLDPTQKKGVVSRVKAFFSRSKKEEVKEEKEEAVEKTAEAGTEGGDGKSEEGSGKESEEERDLRQRVK